MQTATLWSQLGDDPSMPVGKAPAHTQVIASGPPIENVGYFVPLQPSGQLVELGDVCLKGRLNAAQGMLLSGVPPSSSTGVSGKYTGMASVSKALLDGDAVLV